MLLVPYLKDTTNGAAARGDVPAGCVFISVWNMGEGNALIGNNQIIYPGQVINCPVVPDGRYPALSWDKQGSELQIYYIKPVN